MSASFSTATPRPTTDPRPTAARSLTWAWSAITDSWPIAAPATRTAPAPIVAPSPTTNGGGASRVARDAGPSDTGFPRVAPSWIVTPSRTVVPSWITTLPPSRTLSGNETSWPSRRPAPRSDGRSTRALLEGALQRLEHTHHPDAALGAGAWLAALPHAVDEVTALDSQWLLVRDAWAPHVPGAGDVLAVGLEILVKPLVVDGDLPLDLHVVEGGHPPGADDREAAFLVGVEPGEVHVRRE